MSDAERAARTRRRAVARAHHPDLGGDVEEFVRAMRAVSGRPASPVRTTAVVRRRSRVSRAGRAAGRRLAGLTALARRRLPRSFPGSRRYGQL